MSDYYYNNASSTNANDLGNWWIELSGVNGGVADVQAGNFPSSNLDDVYILGDIATPFATVTNVGLVFVGNFGTSHTVNLSNLASTSAIELYSSSQLTGSIIGQRYHFFDTSFLYYDITINNGYSFYNSSINYGIADSNNSSSGFYDYSSNAGSTINGTEFSHFSTNSTNGTCQSATFSTGTINYGNVTENAKFSELVPDGNGEYINQCINGIGNVFGYVLDTMEYQVYLLKYSAVPINIPAIFGNSFIQLNFVNATSNDANITRASSVIFENSTNNGVISNTGSVNFNSAATNNGNITGNGALASIVFASSVNYSNISNFEQITFNSEATNSGSIDSSGLSEYTIIFSDSTNNGTINGNVQFQNLYADLDGMIISDTGIGVVEGGIASDFYGNPITKVKYTLDNFQGTNFVSIFENTSNIGGVYNNAYFYEGAANLGIVGTNAYFYKGSYNQGVVNGITYYQDTMSAVQTLIEAGVGGDLGTKLPFADILGTGLQ